MKNTPFINPLPKKQQQEINQWFLFTVILSSITIVALISYTVYHYTRYTKLNAEQQRFAQESAAFDAATTQLAQLKKEQQERQQRLEALTAHTTTANKLAQRLQEISRVIPNDLHLEAFSIAQNGNIHMSGFGLKAESIHRFVTALNQSELFKNIQLSLLQKQKGTDNQHPSLYFKLLSL